MSRTLVLSLLLSSTVACNVVEHVVTVGDVGSGDETGEATTGGAMDDTAGTGGADSSTSADDGCSGGACTTTTDDGGAGATTETTEGEGPETDAESAGETGTG